MNILMLHNDNNGDNEGNNIGFAVIGYGEKKGDLFDEYTYIEWDILPEHKNKYGIKANLSISSFEITNQISELEDYNTIAEVVEMIGYNSCSLVSVEVDFQGVRDYMYRNYKIEL